MAVTRYPEELRLRLPRGMPEALSLAAGQHHTTPTEWARQALLRGLQAEGVSIRGRQGRRRRAACRSHLGGLARCVRWRTWPTTHVS